MLVLSRWVDEGIDLYDANGRKLATIMPVSIQGNKVRLGVQAVDDVKVMRSELGAPVARQEPPPPTPPSDPLTPSTTRLRLAPSVPA